MNTRIFTAFVPFEIGDVIRPKGYVNQFELVDILTISSAKEEKVTEIIFVVREANTDLETKIGYSSFEWEIVKDEDKITNMYNEE